MKKYLLIAFFCALLSSCSVKKNFNKTQIDSTVIDNGTIETVVYETVIVENDTAAWTEIEQVEIIKPDTVTEIEVKGKNVEAKAVIKDGIIKLTAIAKPQKVKIPQITTIERKTVVKERKNIETKIATKEKIKAKEKQPFSVPWWYCVLLIVILLLILFLKYKNELPTHGRTDG